MPILTEELKKKLEIVNQYKTGLGTFKEGTPDYVKQYDKEIDDFYESEMDGVM